MAIAVVVINKHKYCWNLICINLHTLVVLTEVSITIVSSMQCYQTASKVVLLNMEYKDIYSNSYFYYALSRF